MTKIYTQQMSRSIKFSALSKKKAYGYYCNLCIKYQFPRIHRRYFKPSMIIDVENKYRTHISDARMLRYRDLIN